MSPNPNSFWELGRIYNLEMLAEMFSPKFSREKRKILLFSNLK
jgi:hypothetical protein